MLFDMAKALRVMEVTDASPDELVDELTETIASCVNILGAAVAQAVNAEETRDNVLEQVVDLVTENFNRGFVATRKAMADG